MFIALNTAPLRVSLRRAEPGRVNISVEIAVAGVTADMICRKLEQLTCTISAEIVARDCGAF